MPMRHLVIALFAVACGDSDHPKLDGIPDALVQCPTLQAPAWCKPHALADIDLAGTWTVTGTTTDDHCLGTPTMTDSSFQVTFTINGCTFQNNGQIDDTYATATATMMQGLYSSTSSICVDDTTNLLTYNSSQTQRCIPTNSNPDTITVSGTLSR